MWAAKEEIQAEAGTAAAPDKPLDSQPAVGVVEAATFGWAVNLFPIESLLLAAEEAPAPCIQEISVPQVRDKAVETQGLVQELSQMAVEQQPEVVQAHRMPGEMAESEIKPARLEHLGRAALDFPVATPLGVGAVQAIMAAGAEDTSPQEQTLHPLAGAAPATRATLAMPPCKRAFAMGMGKSSLPIKKAA